MCVCVYTCTISSPLLRLRNSPPPILTLTPSPPLPSHLHRRHRKVAHRHKLTLSQPDQAEPHAVKETAPTSVEYPGRGAVSGVHVFEDIRCVLSLRTPRGLLPLRKETSQVPNLSSACWIRAIRLHTLNKLSRTLSLNGVAL